MAKAYLFQYPSSLNVLQLRLNVVWTFVSHLGKIVCVQQLPQRSNLFLQLKKILKNKSKMKKTILNLIHGIVKAQELSDLSSVYPNSILSPLCRLKSHHSICMKLLQNKTQSMVTVDLNPIDHQHTTNQLSKRSLLIKIFCNSMRKSFISLNRIEILKNQTRDYKNSQILREKKISS